MTVRERARGCLQGLACGDAMGRPLEFETAAQIQDEHGRVTEMLAHGTHGQPAGTVTDDTDLARCIGESLVANDGFDGADVADRFVAWLESDPFDVGLMTRDAIAHVARGTSWTDAGQVVWEGRPEGSNAGNGSVMRCAPHAIAFRNRPESLSRVSRASSAITHDDPRCTWGCVVLNRTIANLLLDRSDPLEATIDETPAMPDELANALYPVRDVLRGSADPTQVEPGLANTGYVVDTLQTGLFFGLTATSTADAIVDVVNRGGDADTVGAVAGAIAGARADTSNPPARWLDVLEGRERLDELATGLLEVDA